MTTTAFDPWVIQPRERTWYEEQFKSLRPSNGIITGEQAKGFFLQSQLPPVVLGQIWGLSDTDADGKMNINEFSIACKLIHLKLRGTEIPKTLPPSLLMSLKTFSPVTNPPVSHMLISSAPPARPQPPKIDPLVNQSSLISTAPLTSSINVMPQVPMSKPVIPQPASVIAPLVNTAVVQPMDQPAVQSMMQPVMAPVQSTGSFPPMQPGFGTTVSAVDSNLIGAPLLPGLINAPVAPVATTMPTQPVMPTATVAPGFAGTMGTSVTAAIPPVVPVVPMVQPTTGVVPPTVPVSVAAAPVAPTSASSTPKSSLDKALSIESPQVEWAVPHQTKLKYTQLFNTTDRARTGYLSGAQARNVMVQSKLPQNILAQIWALSDMDADGQLGCEEFVLAMHLCEQAAAGIMPPAVLPVDLIPPTFRRAPRQSSISSQGSVLQEADTSSLPHQTSFEDKRKENFEKGQAELERRRKALLEAQRKEAEERERKEREENDRKERARHEAERKRLLELEAQMREQQEQERLKDEERKRQAEQREAARKEMERQRQLEWEKQRSQELQQQRQREQEKVLKLKAKNQSLTIELTSLNDQVKELSQKICDTRVGVSNIKTTIDGMRSTRDAQMQEMSQLKNRLKEQNARLLVLSQEKAKLDLKNKMNAQSTNAQNEQSKQAFENKEIKIKQLKDKIEDMQNQIEGKMSDIENNNSQLNDLKTQLSSLVSECESLYDIYEQKRNQVLEMKGTSKTSSQIDTNAGWKDTDNYGWDANNAVNEWPVDNWATETTTPAEAPVATPTGVAKYRALYEFVARNSDEISFQPGDIILVPLEQKGEPGWIAGEIRGHTGWFPESYVEPVDSSVLFNTTSTENAVTGFTEETETKRLEGIAEVPETLSDTSSVDPTLNQPVETKVEAAPVAEVAAEVPEEMEYYIASYPYQSVEQGDLSFNAGEIVCVFKKEGDWWTGKIGENVGIFPSNYVQKMDTNASTTTTATSSSVPSTATTNNLAEKLMNVAAMQQDTSATSGTDTEVSQINEPKTPLETADFAAMSANTQTLRSGKKPEIASVIAPYQATSPEQLSLQRGQLIMVRKKTDSGWWEGELQAKGRRRQVGWFPASYVKVLNSSGRASGRTTPVSSTRIQQEVILDKVIALFPYTANNPDELSFLKDDIISVTARDEPSWWRGELNGVSGLFPSNYVGPLQSCDPQEKSRQDAINELILTEQAYLDDMTTVHEIFEIPLRRSNVLSEEDLYCIFVNWQEIIQCNRQFLEDLLDRKSSGSYIFGDIICKHLPRMTGYITFCSNQLESAALLQRLIETSGPFKDVVYKCQCNPATKGMPLSSFLIKPMQRITKYPLLVRKILEYTSSNHPDYENFCEAQKKADVFCKHLNEGVRMKENTKRLDWLQKYVICDNLNIKFHSNTNCLGVRKLLHHGMLQKLKSGKELIGFLLSDFLLLVQSSKPIGSSQFMFQTNNNCTFKMYKQPIFIHKLEISRGNSENVENGTDMNRLLKIQNDSIQMSLLAPTANECNLWLKRITDACENYKKVQTTHQRKNKNLIGNACGRLLVHVQKGKHIIKSGKTYGEHIFCKVSMGDQEQVTDVVQTNSENGNIFHSNDSLSPYLVWNTSMQFHIKNINEDNLVIEVFEKCLFTPDEFLGKAEVKIKDVVQQTRNTNGPLLKRLILHQVESGEVELKLDLHLFEK